ncbi:TetR family transcriptional regulator [Duganella caerulea]|uniref:TetR/AcrR family transcriptional regulator n=1 Tax=Duganella caerulea TaxID=2885762 RepID=UPI0030EA7A3F
MARPRSEDKRQAIVRAATGLFAQEGLSAPTARIAKAAGVAEGTIFVYFANKDELLNQVYLELKSQLRLSFELPPASASVSLNERLEQFWTAYVAWGLRHPLERVTLSRLEVSDRITDASRELAAQSFHDVIALLVEAMALGVLRHQPPAYIGALCVAMAEATIDFISQNPDSRKQTSADGFAAFWRALTAR